MSLNVLGAVYAFGAGISFLVWLLWYLNTKEPTSLWEVDFGMGLGVMATWPIWLILIIVKGMYRAYREMVPFR